MISVKGYAAQSDVSPLAPFDFERRDLRSKDVLIDILYCGICHSDLHLVRNEWGRSIYPIVPGHEIVGRVIKAGKKAKRFKIGDPAGVGAEEGGVRGGGRPPHISVLPCRPRYIGAGGIS